MSESGRTDDDGPLLDADCDHCICPSDRCSDESDRNCMARQYTECKHPLPDLGRFEQDVCHACGSFVPTPENAEEKGLVHVTWGPTVEKHRKPLGDLWCFGCRQHLPHDLVMFDYDMPTYWDPVVIRECSGCKRDRSEFPRG